MNATFTDPDSLVEELKLVSLERYVSLKALHETLPSLNIEFSGWKVRRTYNGLPMRFSGNHL